MRRIAAEATARRRWARQLGVAAVVSLPLAFLAGTGTASAADGLDVTPGSGPVGTEIVISGTLTCPDVPTGGNILLRFVDLDEGFQTGTNLGMATKQADSSFSGAAEVPAELAQLVPPSGIFPIAVVPKDYTIQASCSISSSSSVPTIGTTFSVTEGVTPPTSPPTSAVTKPPASSFQPPATPPTAADPLTGVSTSQVAPGGTIVIDEAGFAPGESVNVVLYSSPIVLKADVAAGTDGRLVTSVRIPSSTPAGVHTLVLYGDPTVKATSITVSGPVEAQLPVTGLDQRDGEQLALAVGLLILGTGLLVIARRRAVRLG